MLSWVAPSSALPRHFPLRWHSELQWGRHSCIDLRQMSRFAYPTFAKYSDIRRLLAHGRHECEGFDYKRFLFIYLYLQ